jgi:SAM-dependent methyltransferase
MPTTRACPACGQPAPLTTTTVPHKQAIGGSPLRLADCSRCGATFQPTAPTTEELARWYDYMAHIPANVDTSPLLSRRLGRIVGAFDDVRQTNRLLEVGCGGGLFVRAALAASWEVWGTEISPSCAAMLRHLIGARLHEGTVEDTPFPPESFDGAALIEVLEHLADPAAYLTAIHRLVRPGGRIYLTTPNRRGSAGRTLGVRWRGFTDEHLNYFDPRTIAVLLERTGFCDLRIRTTNLDLLVMAAQRVRRLVRPSAPAGNVDAPSSVIAPTPQAANGGHSELRVRIADMAIEVVNAVATTARLGDTLRVVATRR